MDEPRLLWFTTLGSSMFLFVMGKKIASMSAIDNSDDNSNDKQLLNTCELPSFHCLLDAAKSGWLLKVDDPKKRQDAWRTTSCSHVDGFNKSSHP
jgi:hypothetical protein